MDPEGNLFYCGQLDRSPGAANIRNLGVDGALNMLKPRGCNQCWCARVVETNYLWGGRIDMMRPARHRRAS